MEDSVTEDKNTIYWQSTVRSVNDKLSHIFNNEGLVDVNFIVGVHRKVIPANKTILSLYSPVMEVMFAKRWTVRSPDIEEIEIPDAEPIAFRSFLKYIYTKELDTTMSNVHKLVQLSRKYLVEELTQVCIEFTTDNITLESAVFILEQGNFEICDTEIEAVVMKFLCKNATQLVLSPQFIELNQKCLIALMKRDDFCIQDEVVLFNAAYGWARHQCFRKQIEPTKNNIRIEIENLLPCIRFLQMEPEDFVIVADMEVLTQEEGFEILKLLKTRIKPHGMFQYLPKLKLVQSLCSRQRCRPKSSHVITRVLRTENHVPWPNTKPSEYKHCFQVNHVGSIVSVGFFGPFEELGKLDIFLALRNCEEDFAFATVYVIVEPEKIGGIFHVPFKSPVPLTPGVWYKLCFAIKGPKTCAGNGQPLYEVTIGEKNKIVIKFKDSTDSNMINQIPELCFEF